MDFVMENFERVIAMAHGRILCEGNAQEVFAQGEILKEARLQKPHILELKELMQSGERE
jgi:energy-coupling factor transport system ATP-binding protein